MDAINAVFDTKKQREATLQQYSSLQVIPGNPFADGHAIQATTVVDPQNRMDCATILRRVREARSKGLAVPVLPMGYYNSILAYGEDQAVQDAREAVANG